MVPAIDEQPAIAAPSAYLTLRTSDANSDASDALTLTLWGGLAGYDLLFADSGPVLDTAVEVRW